jgi:hypothetical protein
VTKGATIAEMDNHGNLHVLRPGTNGWTCIPGSATEVGEPPMCADEVATQRNKDSMKHKPKPTNTVPGIEYMLAGATQRSDSDPTDRTDPPIKIGPHWMILWPFDPQTSGLPTTHRPTGAYIEVQGEGSARCGSGFARSVPKTGWPIERRRRLRLAADALKCLSQQ